MVTPFDAEIYPEKDALLIFFSSELIEKGHDKRARLQGHNGTFESFGRQEVGNFIDVDEVSVQLIVVTGIRKVVVVSI